MRQMKVKKNDVVGILLFAKNMIGDDILVFSYQINFVLMDNNG